MPNQDFTFNFMTNLRNIPIYSGCFRSTLECLIRAINLSSYKKISRLKINYYELLTNISSVYNVLNCRPINYKCSEDVNLKIITLNCFLRFDINED